jgi:hypothetical protein
MDRDPAVPAETMAPGKRREAQVERLDQLVR